MNLKAILLAIFCSISIVGFAQNDKISLKADINKYVIAVQTGDAETTLDYIYPKFFDLAPRDLIKGFLEKSAEQMKEFTISNSKINSITPIIKTDTNYHSLVDYSFQMLMPLELEEEEITDEEEVKDDNSDEDADEVEEKELSKGEFMLETMQAQYGKENVKFNEDKTALIISIQNKMLAIKTDKLKTWTFITYSQKQRAMLEKMVAAEILKNYE